MQISNTPIRDQKILSLIKSSGFILAETLSSSLGISIEQIRQDLVRLEQCGKISRRDNGARSLARTILIEDSLETRNLLHSEAKTSIGFAAYQMLIQDVPNSIMLDAGTTTARLADLLNANFTSPRALAVFTNSVQIAYALYSNKNLNVHFLGGTIRSVSGTGVGPYTISSLASLKPDICFLGADAVNPFGFSTTDAQEASVKTQMVQSAHKTIALIDSSKFDAEASVFFADIDEVHGLVCDALPSGDLADSLCRTRIIVA